MNTNDNCKAKATCNNCAYWSKVGSQRIRGRLEPIGKCEYLFNVYSAKLELSDFSLDRLARTRWNSSCERFKPKVDSAL